MMYNMTFYDDLDKSNLKEYFKKLGNICLKHLMLSSDSYVRMIELNMNGFKYVFIGNPTTTVPIGAYPDKDVSKSIITDANNIFERYCKSQSKSIDIRSRVQGKEGIYYFTINSQNVFYLIVVDSSINERDVFGLIDDIQKENIPLLIDTQTNKLNLVGRQQLKTIIENYSNNLGGSNKITQINIELKETRELMKDNIKDLTKNLDSVQDLEKQSEKIKESAGDFNKNAVALRKVTCWQNCKWWIILILVIILLLVIILPISLTSGKSDKKKDDEQSSSP